MNLSHYPRPANDTGIGMHWSAGFPAAVGLGKIREMWLPQLRNMGVSWVKIANHDGALGFAELLLAEGFMPIVRLYRPQPNPGTLTPRQIQQMDELIRAGVRYFEFNNEPDLGIEWRGGQVPPNALDLVAESAIQDMQTILGRGGMPGVPAVATGTRWDLVGKIIEKGGRSLFDGPVWQAVHNYSVNHPLDYPYDFGNQEGAPITQAFYDQVRAEQWGRDAWNGRSLEEVNRLRAAHANPGATIMDDASCWLAYQRFDQLNRQHLGRSLPLLSTENGYLVGEGADPRYPATTPNLHMAQTVEACRVMMGTSRHYPAAPDYYFCTAFWLMGNYVLGSSSPWWEPHAWFGTAWPKGKLPVVDALTVEPKQARPHLQSGDEGMIDPAPSPAPGEESNRSRIDGAVTGGAGASLVLVREGDGRDWETLAGDDGAYAFVGLGPGRYSLFLYDHERMVEGITLDGTDGPGGAATVDMAVPGWGHTVRDGGPAPGFGVIRVNVVAGLRNLPVRAFTQSWSSPPVLTGSKSEYGSYACEIAPLSPGHYTVEVDGLSTQSGDPLQAHLFVDDQQVRFVEFIFTDMAAIPGPNPNPSPNPSPGPEPAPGPLPEPAPEPEPVPPPQPLPPPPPRGSALVGVAPDMAGKPITLSGPLLGVPGGSLTVTVGEDDHFRFDNLPAGPVNLAVDDIRQIELTLDGVGGQEVIFSPLSAVWRGHVRSLGVQPGSAVVRVRVADRLNLPVRLWAQGWPGLVHLTGSKAEYGPTALEFAPLGPGHYTVEPQELGTTADVELSRGEIVLVRFEPSVEAISPPRVAPWPPPEPEPDPDPDAQPEPEPSPDPEPDPEPVFDFPLYLWVDAGGYSQEILLAFLRFYTAYVPETGDDANVAARSRRVIIMSEQPARLESRMADLREQGCQVYVLDADRLAIQLVELVSFGLSRLEQE